MEKGYIQSQQELNWHKKKTKLVGSSIFDPDAIVLSEFSFFKGSCVEAYLCDSCKKIVIDIEDEIED